MGGFDAAVVNVIWVLNTHSSSLSTCQSSFMALCMYTLQKEKGCFNQAVVTSLASQCLLALSSRNEHTSAAYFDLYRIT